MAKATSTNIVEVWNWLVNVIESGELSLTEQIVLVHTVAKFNRTMWTPTKLNKKLLAAAINKDTRTVNSALDKLVKLKILTETKGVYFIGQLENTSIPTDRGTTDNPAASSGRRKFNFKTDNADADVRGVQGVSTATDTGGNGTDSGDVPSSAGTGRKRRKVFDTDAV